VDGLTVSDLARFDAIHYRGVVWCVKVPTGAFVARRNGKVFVTGNSGFPKSLDVSKAIDSHLGAEREVVGTWKPTGTARVKGGQGSATAGKGSSGNAELRDELPITAPSSDAAKQWSGYGTTTKPAYEPLVVARKNMDGTVAANVLAHGCGVLNIDAARIVSSEILTGGGGKLWSHYRDGTEDTAKARVNGGKGRFPAAVVGVHDEDCELVGVTRIRGDARTGGGTREGGFVDTAASSGDSVPNAAGKGDPDGTETVDEWRCTETCAVAELARQSGTSKDGVAVQRNGGGQKIGGCGVEDAGDRLGGWAGATREDPGGQLVEHGVDA
jgi:hypothetical protein